MSPACRFTFVVFALLLAAPGATPVSARMLEPATQPAAARLADLAFLRGTWRVEQKGMMTEETWTAPAGGTMMGVGRTIRGDRTVFFEFLRIEQRGGDLFYIASPRGQGTTEFKLTSAAPAEGKFVFENPDHDFPRKIAYERQGDDAVRATISGPRNGQEASESWEYRRAK